MTKVASSLSMALFFACLAAPTPSAAESYFSLNNGIEVRVIPGQDDSRMSIRVDTSVGIIDEATADGGGVAALLATLIHARTPSQEPGQWAQAVLDSGLTLTPHLELYSSGFTLSGGLHLLRNALWLVGERMGPLELKEAGVRKVRPTIFMGAESDKYHAISARGDELATLNHLLLGPKVGRSSFESRLRALRLPSNAFKKAALKHYVAVAPKIIMVLPQEAFDKSATLVETFIASLKLERRATGQNSREARKPTLLRETIRGRFENPRDSASIVGLAWNLSTLEQKLGWSKTRLETVAETLVSVLSHPGGSFQRALQSPKSKIIETKVNLTGANALALLLTATCQPRTFAKAKAVIDENLHQLLNAGDELGRAPDFAKSRIRELRAALRTNASRARLTGVLWTSGRLKADERLDSWLTRFFDQLSTVSAADVRRLLTAIVTEKGRVEAKFVPERSVRSREIGLTEDIMTIYERIVTDSRCPRPDIKKMKWTELLKRKYGLTAETYVRLSQKITARARLMRRISRAADQQCAQFERLRELRTYDDIASIHRAVSCGPASIRDFELRQKAMNRVFRTFDLDPSLYRPLLAMAREDVTSRAKLHAIERSCPPKYGPGVDR